MSLEAGLAHSPVAPARDAFGTFAADVAQGDLRTERCALVNLETDRIANSLNTLSFEIFQWLHSPAAR
ncbi:MAG TPA: hypothetical protein VG456_12960 [Candidatus Sulfopaludibacter sp.]|jgi:hypothetical protein|nr:hypothetical protein [Candidatus Sulfopaludibacter sp.]